MRTPFLLATTLFSIMSFYTPSTYAGPGHDHGLPKALNKVGQSQKPVAYVNDSVITEADVLNQTEEFPDMLTSGRDDEVRQAIVERLIQKRLVFQEAQKLGIENDPIFLQQLETLKENLIFNFVISQKLDAALTPARLKEYYEKNGKNYAFPSVKAGHILVKTEDEAKTLIKKLDKGGDFTELAVENSTGPAAVNGGMLGWLAPNTMVEPFESAVFSMEVGTHSKEPVQTQFGYHVIKVFDKDANHIPSFEELEYEIQERLAESVITDFVDTLKQKAKIRYEESN